MSSPSEFDALFDALGLTQLASGVSVEATFRPRRGEMPGGPQPQAALHTISLAGTLPRLELVSPTTGSTETAEPELEPLELLGQGGMGRVFLARQRSLERNVAVKVLHADAASAVVAESLVHEAKTLGAMEHPSVVPVYALGRDGAGAPALVMRRVEGVEWRELIHNPTHTAWGRVERQGDPLAFHVEVLIQVCNAVAHAHAKGVIHRDIKPANVLVGELGEVYLVDWGVALHRRASRAEGIQLVGTPAYMAPEMVAGEAARIDERTDVYLLGASLHEILAGAPPHLGGTLKEVLQRAREPQLPILPASAPSLLAAVCRRALAPAPADRFSSVTELRDELKRFLRHRGASGVAEAAQKRLAQLEASSAARDDASQRAWFTLVSECRFGFQQALELSSEHLGAREGLKRCLTVAAQHELGRGATGSARAFLAELDQPPPKLMERLAALEAEDRQKEAAHAEVQRFREDLDVDVSHLQRLGLMLAMTVPIVVMVVMFVVYPGGPLLSLYSGYGRLLPPLITSCLFASAALLGRRALFRNRVNRQIMAVLGVGLVGSILHRSLSVWTQVSIPVSLAQESILAAMVCAVAGFSVHPSFLLSALTFLLSAAGCAFWPEAAVGIFGAMAAVSFGLMSAAFYFWRQRRGSG